MKKRGILIGAAVGLVVLTAGILIAIYMSNPEILTRDPSEIVSGEIPASEGQAPISQSQQPLSSPVLISEVSIDSPGSCLITSEVNCSKALSLHKNDGTRFPGIGFANIPAGTIIYTPIDGYLSIYEVKDSEGVTNSVLAISTTSDWSLTSTNNKPGARVVFFTSPEIRPLLFGEVKKGQAVGQVFSDESYINNQIRETIKLSFNPDIPWHEMIDAPSDDPVEYINQAIKIVNR